MSGHLSIRNSCEAIAEFRILTFTDKIYSQMSVLDWSNLSNLFENDKINWNMTGFRIQFPTSFHFNNKNKSVLQNNIFKKVERLYNTAGYRPTLINRTTLHVPIAYVVVSHSLSATWLMAGRIEGVNCSRRPISTLHLSSTCTSSG